MPRYIYQCSECDEINSIIHGINEIYDTCKFCKSKDCLIKLLTKPMIKKNTITKDKVGDITKKYIEDNRIILEDIKKERTEDNYEPS